MPKCASLVFAFFSMLWLALPSQAQDEGGATPSGSEEPGASGQPTGDPEKGAGEAEAGLPPMPKAEELPPPPAGFTETTLESAARPPLNLLDLHGYLRLRGDLMNSLTLGLPARTSRDTGAAYPQFPGTATGKGATNAGANMRLRIEPTINISEDVRIMAQLDILDNLVLGSTPDGFPKSGYYPMVAFTQSQNPPIAGFNSFKDSILVKRAYGEVMTPLGLLRFGRVPSHWGLGLLANDGGPSHVDFGPQVTRKNAFDLTNRCFECDYGSSADRIMFVTKIAGHYIVPMVEFASEGPFYNRINELSGQAFDFDQLDDVNAWILAVAKRDKPEDIRHALENDDWVLNYGLYFVFRNQSYDAIDYQNQNLIDPWAGANQKLTKYALRNAEAYIPDVWLRFMWKKLRIELEACMIIGKIGYDTQSPSVDAEGHLIRTMAGDKVDILQFGGVLQADYSFLNDSLIAGLELGLASGDDSPGFGVRPLEERQYGAHTDPDTGEVVEDHSINNFRFNPDYRVDMILWRQIIGTVTDALYVKPSLQYNITEGLGAKLSAIYSAAMYQSSTRGKSHGLGLEFDLDLFYFSDDNFHAGLSYGLLIPFAGMKDLGADELPGGMLGDADESPDVAHRIMGRLVLYF